MVGAATGTAMTAPTILEAIGFFQLSREQPRVHVIQEIADTLIAAAQAQVDLLAKIDLGEALIIHKLDYESAVAAWEKGHPDGFYAGIEAIVDAALGIDDTAKIRTRAIQARRT